MGAPNGEVRSFEEMAEQEVEQVQAGEEQADAPSDEEKE